jgi:radical SAM-linked protein
VETLTQGLIEDIKRVRKTNFTLAPEAGTQRMRDIINKGVTESDLLATTARIFEAGWKSIKLYFMIGLPDEKEEDIYGIIDLAQRVLTHARNTGQVTVSLSTFVPKPHTPFQWHRQIDIDEIIKKQTIIKKSTYKQNLNIKWHDARMSILEGILSRGDEKIGALIEKAFHCGCRFDGWADNLRFDLWEAAMEKVGIDAKRYLGKRVISEELPWNHIDTGLRKDFLLHEYKKSQQGALTADCRCGSCTNCGVCNRGAIELIMATQEKTEPLPGPQMVVYDNPHPQRPFRIAFSKQGMAGFLSHLEVSSALVRALCQSGFILSYSAGFHPHPKISFAFATAVGMESLGEYADIWFDYMEEEQMPKAIAKANSALPEGLKILSMHPLTAHDRPLSECINGFEYCISIPQALDDTELSKIAQNIDAFLKSTNFVVPRQRKGKSSVKNIRPFIQHIGIDYNNRQIKMTVSFGNTGTVSPAEVITKVIRVSRETSLSMRTIKTDTLLKQHP